MRRTEFEGVGGGRGQVTSHLIKVQSDSVPYHQNLLPMFNFFHPLEMLKPFLAQGL